MPTRSVLSLLLLVALCACTGNSNSSQSSTSASGGSSPGASGSGTGKTIGVSIQNREAPYDSQAIGSAIAEANKAGIPVFTADIASTSKDGTVVSHIASDNVQGGGQAAKLMCAAMAGKAGSVAIIDEPEVTSVQDRVKGFRAGLASGCPNVKVVADIDGGGERAKANNSMEDILQSHK